MQKKHLLFDLDGTISDSQEGIKNAIEYMLSQYDIKIEDRESLRGWLGPPLRDSLQKYHGICDEMATEAIKHFRVYYDKQGYCENKVYHGMEDLLKELQKHGYQLYVATSKPEIAAKRILQMFQLDQYFTFIGGASLDDKRSTKAEVIAHVLNNNRIDNLSEAVMIGDREHDVLGGKEMGIESIGVLYGYGDREELEQAGADHIVEQPLEVLDILATWVCN